MRALTNLFTVTSFISGQDTKSGTEIVKSNFPFSRPYEPICDDPNFATYDPYEPDDWCYETYGDYVYEKHYSYLPHLESNQIYTCNRYEVQKLIDQGVDLNSVEYQGRPILYHAVKNGYSSIVKMLLNAGASYDFKMPDGRGLLHMTASNGHYFNTRELILAHPSTQKRNPLTELFTYSNRVNQIKQMVDVKDHRGITPLIIAADLGHPNIVKILIDFGADKDHIDGNGWSARTIVDHHLSKKDESEIPKYQFIASLLNTYKPKLRYEDERLSLIAVVLVSAYYCVTLPLLYRSFKKISGVNKDRINEMLGQIKEWGSLSAEEIELLKEKLPFTCPISYEELTSSNEIYCVEDIKTLYEQTALVSWITRTAKFSDDRNDITFINPITSQRVSISRVFDVTKQLKHFLKPEEVFDQSQSQEVSADEQAADQSQSQAASADEQAVDQSVAANAFAAMVSSQRQMQSSGKSL